MTRAMGATVLFAVQARGLLGGRVVHPGRGDDSPRAPRWPAFDGLRAVAVLAVMGVHLGVLPGGYLGVDVFFVLSGFLITSLLIEEWDSRGGRFGFRDFYARRVLRIIPALLCVIIGASVLAALLEVAGGAGNHAVSLATFQAIPWVFAFVVNWIRALKISSFLGLLGPTWSLSVEEQFYLLWPALLALLMRRRPNRARAALWLAALAMTEMVYRAVMTESGYGHDRIYYGTDTHSDGLLIGCAIAFWLASNRSSSLSERAGTPLKLAAWFGAATLAILFVSGGEDTASLDISAAVLASGLIVIAVAAGQTPAALERILCARWAAWIGRRSYGLYLWQYVILVPALALCVRYTGINPAAGERRFLLALVLGAVVLLWFLAAGLSYRLVELPALRYKRRFRRAPVQPMTKSDVDLPALASGAGD